MSKIPFKKKRRSKARDTSGRLKKVSVSQHSKLSKKEQKRLAYLKNAPKNPVKRFFWRLSPKNAARYWFSKKGAIRIGQLSLAGVVSVFLVIGGVYAYYKGELPSPQEVQSKLGENTIFYDRTGKTKLFELSGDENRKPIEFEQLSDNIKNATIAIEDQSFYEHHGFSIKGITRAILNNVNDTGSVQGGSTITQQYIKNSALTSERRLERKIKELILSVELERLYDKNEILTAYLNEIPYGGTIYGVESAAQNYFGKTAKELSIAESAFLAGIPQQPGSYNPCDPSRFQKESFLRRQDTVIGNMQKLGYINDEQSKTAKADDTLATVNCEFNPYKDAIAPHFIDEVQKSLVDAYGQSLVRQGGLNVITTLDLETQQVAEETVQKHIGLVEGLGGNNLALVAGDQRTGQIHAVVGSRDYSYPEFGAVNVGTRPRQPGSSFKPYAYAELFETGKWGPGSTLYDLKTDFGGGYIPKNFNTGQFAGAITVRRSLAQSLNIPAVKALYIAGLDNVIAQAKSQGITTLNDRDRYGLSLVLGAGEVKLADMVTGYGSFATNGQHFEQTYILKVTNSQGEVLQEYDESENGKRVLDAQVAYLMTDMLSDREARFSALNRVNYTAAIKTGTTSDVKDFWTMGYTDHITAGVWVGNHDNKRMAFNASSLSISPIWIDFMNTLHEKKDWKDRAFAKPEGIKPVTLDFYTGRLANGNSSKKTTDLFPSFYTAGNNTDTSEFTIDTITNKLATDCTPENTRKEVTINGIDAEISPDDPAYSRWSAPVKAWAASIGQQGGITTKPTESDDLHKCGDKTPNITALNVSKASGSNYTLEATVSSGTHKLKQIDFKVDGSVVKSVSAGSSGTFTTTVSLAAGQRTITALAIDVAGYQDTESKTITATADSNLSIISPSGTTSAGTITLKWTADSDAANYSVTYACSPGGPSNSNNNIPSSTTSLVIGNVNAGVSCTWSVSSKHSNGATLDTVSATFVTN